MAFTLNRRLSTLVDSNGQLNTGKIPNDYITSDHVADNSITTAMLHTGFTLPTSSLSSIDTDNITEGSTNLFYTDARVDSRLSGGTGVTYSSGTISIGQAVATSDSPTFADLTVTGNLNITGDINSYNVTDLDVTDQTITLGAGQIESNSGGSGIIIDGSNASILWDETNDQFDFNKGINIDSNTLVVDGTNNRVGILNAAPDVSLDIGSSTDAIHMPVGTTAQRPGSPAAGYFRYNSDDGQFEGYTTEWGAIAGSGGASAMETNNFTGDGSTTAFTLSSTVASEDNLIVFIEGIYQNKGDYVASGTTITFTTAPVNGRRIVVQHIKSSVAGNSTLYTSLSGDGSTTAFTLSGAPGHENNTQVFMDGVYQQKDSYIVNGTTLTFDAAPANGSSIEVMSFAQTTINQPGSNTVSVAELNLSDGTSGQAIVTDGNGTISFATISGTTINNNADNRIITGSGTANTLEGESNLTYDGSTLAVTGTATISTDLNVGGAVKGNAGTRAISVGTAGSVAGGIQLWAATNSQHFIQFGDEAGTSANHYRGFLGYNHATDSMQLGTTGTERMRIDGDGNITMSSTGSMTIPSGTTAQRPASPTAGMVRYNTTEDYVEYYNGSGWFPTSQSGVEASGGTETLVGGYKIHTFTSSGTFTVTSGGEVEYLVIAGGGGGGSGTAGGGGAGGYRTNVSGETSGGGASAEGTFTASPQGYTVTVGAGGAGGAVSVSNPASGSNSVFGSITSIGGGAGGEGNPNNTYSNGLNGGSGGGAWLYNSSGTAGSGTSGQGYAGGGNPSNGGSGGGGAGAVGVAGATGNPDGGTGVSSSITGSAVTRAGGGGGGKNPTAGAGGAGGGGAGHPSGSPATSGTVNTGGGGGGGYTHASGNGGNGGSGIVIIRYLV